MTYTTPIPGVAQQGMAANAAKLAYDRALAKIGQKRGDLLRQHGYTGQFDQSGNISGLKVDAQNPYGLYQQNRRAHALAGEQAQNQVQSRGISGGLARQAESRERYGWGFDDAQQGQQLTRGISSLIGEQDDAYGQYNNTLWQEQLEMARNAILNQRFNQADYSGLDYPEYGDYDEDSTPPITNNVGSMAPISPAQNVTQMQALIKKLTPGSSVNEATRMAAQMPKAPVKMPAKKAAPKPGASGAEIMRINNAIKAAKPKKKGGK